MTKAELDSYYSLDDPSRILVMRQGRRGPNGPFFQGLLCGHEIESDEPLPNMTYHPHAACPTCAESEEENR